MTRHIVAFVGRPNVGKSTLFNRFLGGQYAVVHETPGTTRDRLYGEVEWRGRTFSIVDTGGIGLDASGKLDESVIGQAEAAIQEADAIVFLTDVRAGPISSDVDIAERLRRTTKPVLLVANKGDSPSDRTRGTDFFELGLGEPLVVSAMRGMGTGDLLDRIVESLPPDGTEGEEEETDTIPVAILGRPNVGKSSLLNAIAGEERVIVNQMPGTTRDAIDTTIEHAGRKLVLIDTAGIRRRGRIERGIEAYSVMRAMRAVDRADVAVLVIDADDGVTAQDAHVGGAIHDGAKGAVIAVNKWDLVPRSPDAGAKYLKMARQGLGFLDYAPVVFISAKTGLNVNRVLDQVIKIHAERSKRIPTAQVNEFMREITTTHPLSEGGKQVKVLYATQAAANPPTFVIFVNDPEIVHFSHKRYIENQLRRRFGFEGTGIKIVIRGRSEPSS
jgi:GTP-binding protein